MAGVRSLHGCLRSDLGSALVAAIIVAGLCSSHFGCRRSDDVAPPIPSPSVTSAEKGLEITVFPRDGEVVRDLGIPVVVEFSRVVDPDAFSFRITPDPGGWEPAWHGTRHRVELRHADPFQADTEYELEVVLTSGPTEVVRFTAARPSTLKLIDAAEAAGEIDLDTAWTYRLQRLFQPGRLPIEFRSDVPVRCGTPLLRGFDRARSTLRPSTLDALEPYLVRPDDPRRAVFEPMDEPRSMFARFFPRRTRDVYVMVQTDEEDMRPKVTSEWDSVFCVAAPVKVWAPKPYMATAREVCEDLRNPEWDMYGSFKRLMTREPGDDTSVCPSYPTSFLRDTCFTYNGGSPDIDFYLVPSARLEDDGGWCRSVNPDDRHSPQWIEIDRDLSGEDLAATIAHELFHAFQSAWDDWEDSWWQEATATWAEEYIDPEWETEDDLPLVFDKAYNRQITLNREDGDHEYAIYLFPYYLETIQPGTEQVIADIWKECEGPKGSLDAIDSVLKGQFDTTLRDFSVVNLDLEPYDDRYPLPLDLFGYHSIFKWKLDTGGEAEIEVQHPLPPLSAAYDMVYNELDPQVTPLVRFRLDEIANNDKYFLHAIIDDGTKKWDEDWSRRSERVFCINRDDEWFGSIALVFVSAERGESQELGETATGTDAPSGEGAEGGTIPIVTMTVTTETEPCRPLGGSGHFTVKKQRRSLVNARTYRFTEHVTGQVTLEPFDRKNGKFPGRASVQLTIEIEEHIPYNKDQYITIEGSGEVECVLSYPFGNEDADYKLICEDLPIRRTRRTIKQPEGIEETVVNSGATDIDDWCIGSHTGGKPAQYQTDLSGYYHDETPPAYGSQSQSCSWSIHLDAPER